MNNDIKVPVLGESLSEATIARWLKQEGDYAEIDEPIVELETDKVTVEVGAPLAGILEKILIKEQETVEVGALLGKMKAGEKPKSTKESLPAKQPEKDNISSAPDLSPAVTRLVGENKLDPKGISGSGKGGRLLKEDVLKHLEKPSLSGDRQEERVRLSRLRLKIAERLKEAQNTAAILTTFNEIDMQAVMNLRDSYKEAFEKKHQVKLGFMSFFVKACVAALKEIPLLNAQIQGEEIIFRNYCDIGVAVSTDQGLVVPVLRNAEHLTFAEIEKGITGLAGKAREGKLALDDLSGGTFSITNGGVFGSLLSTPIINPPQSGILGLHKIEKRAVVMNEQIVIRPMMYLALSYDHRLIDGKEAVTFLVRIKEALEDPRRLLIEV